MVFSGALGAENHQRWGGGQRVRQHPLPLLRLLGTIQVSLNKPRAGQPLPSQVLICPKAERSGHS